MLLNELNSNDAHFTMHKSNKSCKKSGYCWLRNCCRDWRVVLIFATKSVHVGHFTGPRQTCFAWSDVTPVNECYQVKSQYSCNLICCKKSLNKGSKMPNIALIFQLVLQQCFERISCTCLLLVLPWLRLRSTRLHTQADHLNCSR